MDKTLQARKVNFPNLDGLRFFSFFLVFLSHAIYSDSPVITSTTWYRQIKLISFSGGEIGVSFFFVLSGFLITYLLLQEKNLKGKIDIPSFYVRRALRIWPLYYFVVLFGFIAFPAIKQHFGQTPHETANPALCSAFLNNFDRIKNGEPDSSLLGVLWSVAIEEQFYLVWPLLFAFTPAKFYRAMILLVIAGSTIFRAINYSNSNIDLHTLGVVTDLAIGGLGAELMINNAGMRKRVEMLPRSAIVLALAFSAILIIFNYTIFSSPVLFVCKRMILASTFIVIILDQSFNRNSLFNTGKSKVLTALGRRTYGLYCLHGLGILFSLTILRKLGKFNTGAQMWLLEIPFSLLLAVMISWISFRFLESPFLKLKKRFSYIVKE